MKEKTERAVVIILIFVLVSFMPMFTDPFHQKLEKVSFWEWLGKEIWELWHGEMPHDPIYP